MTHYRSSYESPLGEIVLAADEQGLTGLWFSGQKYFGLHLADDAVEGENESITAAKKWLDEYFAGQEPTTEVPLHYSGTDFQNEVWDILCEIPYGQTMTYGEIAQKMAKRRGKARMSSQAVGGAVGHNEISLIVPCHRVVGANGSLTGYAGGIDKKTALLKLEGAWKDSFFTPKKSTAP